VGQLSGGIARDFNNQLMIVLGNLETAEQVAKGLSGAALPRVQRALVNAVRGAQHAAALTAIARLLAAPAARSKTSRCEPIHHQHR
jgi:hypothetical protein